MRAPHGGRSAEYAAGYLSAVRALFLAPQILKYCYFGTTSSARWLATNSRNSVRFFAASIAASRLP